MTNQHCPQHLKRRTITGHDIYFHHDISIIGEGGKKQQKFIDQCHLTIRWREEVKRRNNQPRNYSGKESQVANAMMQEYKQRVESVCLTWLEVFVEAQIAGVFNGLLSILVLLCASHNTSLLVITNAFLEEIGLAC